MPAAAFALEGNVENGAKVFKKCAACHNIETQQNKIGPTLSGVIGRTAGTFAGFNYSKAMVAAGAAGLVWTEAELAAYLPAPKAKVPGTSMAFIGVKKEQELADVIAYIKTFSPPPAN